ncbi:polysaccharide deacetylase [Nitrosospira sp. Nsp2]|uniref:polysaccharide deacetylase family protein n=1 Tax=Nitrosospira sp. Nsp2 TaxID=136548 RepID=UPI000D30AE9B|nr:polysaccharide deacetylase family protein [Nitrosospira sp. Nsp2]PTR17510.1 polysaccharide deacetylase [Nitrosospira sp. Nsp2]
MATIIKRLTKGTLLTKAELDANFTNLNKELIQLTPAIFAPRAAYGNVLIEPPVAGITVTAGANVSVSSSAQATVGGETLWVVTATGTGAGPTNNFEINLPVASEAFSAKDIAFEIYTPDMSKVESMTLYVGSAAYAKFASRNITTALVPTTQGPFAINGLTAYFVHEALWTKSGFTHPVGDLDCTQCKLRVFLTSGNTATIGLRSVRAGVMRKKARLAITADDGYSSFMRMGLPILQEYGLKSTMSIIYATVGTSTYASLSDLQAYVAAGNECIAHGPNHPTTLGAGNLFSVWTTDAERLADVLACKNYLVANSLTSEWGAKCYIWPQGKYANTVTDLAFLGLMLDNGFSVARTADGANPAYHMQKNNALSTRNLQRLCGPIIGHTWTSSGTEAANIATIISYINDVAAAGGDATLMIHRVVGPDAAANSIQISSNRLRELCVAIRAQVDAGALDVVLYSEYAR